MAPSYDRRKFGWLDRVMRDASLSTTTRCVGFAIYRYLNETSGNAWPAQETIRRDLGIGNIRTVRASLRALSKAGYIQIDFDPFKRTSNTYTPLFAPSDADGGSFAYAADRGGNSVAGENGGNSAPDGGGTFAPSGRGNIAPDGRGTFAPSDGKTAPKEKSIGALLPPMTGQFHPGGEGQIAPLNNLSKHTKRNNAWTLGDAVDRQVPVEGTSEEEVAQDPKPIGDTWALVKNAVVEQHGPRARGIVDQLTLCGRDGDNLVLATPGSYVRDVVRREYLATIIAAFSQNGLLWLAGVRVDLRSAEAAR